MPIYPESITEITTAPLAEPYTKLSDNIEVTLGKFHDGHLAAFIGPLFLNLVKPRCIIQVIGYTPTCNIVQSSITGGG